MAKPADATPPAHSPSPEPDGHRLLRRHHDASLAFGDRRAEVRFVIDGASGRLAIPIEAVVLRHSEAVLHVPSEAGCELQLSGSPSRIERPEAEEACDRWGVYHGRATMTTWAWFSIEGGKALGHVWDGASVMRPNALRGSEGRLLKPLNADRARLAAACQRLAGITVAEPMAVGADPFGIDVRARFGIIRIEFAEPASDPDHAAGLVARLLGGA